MFILIKGLLGKGITLLDFNTSHVYINPNGSKKLKGGIKNFNTSHVYINRSPRIARKGLPPISIHLMFILIRGVDGRQYTPEYISIHLMFILIQQGINKNRKDILISIHLMFILIPPDRSVWRLWKIISIHLMFILIFACIAGDCANM